MVCESFINFLDLECSLVHTFSGTWNIFIGVAILVVMSLAGALRMPMAVVGAGIALLGLLLAFWSAWLFYISLIIGAILIGLSIARAFSR